MTDKKNTLIEIGMFLPTGEGYFNNERMWFCGEGATEEEAMAEFIARVRRNNLLSRRLENGSIFLLEELKTLPENIFPATHGLLVVDTGKHGYRYKGARRYLLIPKGTVLQIEHECHDRNEEIEISDDPTLFYHDRDCCNWYRFTPPRGSVEFVDGAWVDWTPDVPEE